MTRTAATTTAAMLLALLFLAGCTRGAPTSIALSEEPGIPSNAPVTEPWDDPEWRGEPLGWVSGEGGTITIVTFGSSSCPYIAVRLEVLTVRQLAIDFEKAPAEACTDDLAPHTHVFAVPEGIDSASAGLEAEVSLTDNAFGDSAPHVVSVPIRS